MEAGSERQVEETGEGVYGKGNDPCQGGVVYDGEQGPFFVSRLLPDGCQRCDAGEVYQYEYHEGQGGSRAEILGCQ